MIDSTIITKVRRLINENLITDTDRFEYGASDVFKLSNEHAQDVTTVYVNDEELGSGAWDYDATTNRVTLTSGSASTGDILEIEYSTYSNYSDTEISNYVKSALIHISLNQYKTFEVDAEDLIQPTPSEREENLIAIVTSILIKPNNLSYSVPDLRIIVPVGSLPTEELIAKSIAIFKRDSQGLFDIVDIG